MGVKDCGTADRASTKFCPQPLAQGRTPSSASPLCAVRWFTTHGECGLRRKVWSTATPCKLPTDFGVHIIYLMQQFDSCACRRFKWCPASARGGSQGISSGDARWRPCFRRGIKDIIPPPRCMPLPCPMVPWASKLCLSTHVRARSPQVLRMSTIRRRRP